MNSTILHSIAVPRESANDDNVMVRRWRSTNGDFVNSGSILVVVETVKVIIEIQAEADGYLEILKGEGEEAKVGEVIGRVHERPIEPHDQPREIEGTAAHQTKKDQLFSRKARELIKEHRLRQSDFNQATVRERDVLDFLGKLGGSLKRS